MLPCLKDLLPKFMFCTAFRDEVCAINAVIHAVGLAAYSLSAWFSIGVPRRVPAPRARPTQPSELMTSIVRATEPWEYYCRKVAINHPSKCWEWMGSCGAPGYGNWGLGGVQGAHRATYRLFYGEPSNMVLHKCGNRRCCNPNHLYDGTSQQNRRDAESHGMAPVGSRHGQSKLTEGQVLAIRNDNRQRKVIAAEYGVSPTAITNIKRRKTWAWL